MRKIVLLLVCLMVFVSGLNVAFAEEAPIVIGGAMDVESLAMVESLSDVNEITYGGWTFWKGKLDDYPVVIARTEVGVTNAAASTTLAIEKFQPRVIINQGTSGGHDPRLHRYDIVLGEKTVNFGSFNSDRGEYGEGINAEEWKQREMTLRLDGEEIGFQWFESDPQLVDIAQRVNKKYTHGKIVEGTVGTADEWNRELDRIKWIHENYGTSVEEMETASVAQVARAYNIPFLSIRILSNSEIHDGEDFDPNAGIYCQEYTLEVARELIKEFKAN